MVHRLSLIIAVFIYCDKLIAQTEVFKEKGKWGIREKETVLIKPVHDTVFNFDSTGRVCLVCAETRSPHPNKYIKTPVLSFNCNYVNKKGERLVIKQKAADTTGIFSLHKGTQLHYLGKGEIMTVEVGHWKHLVNKDFKQLTFEEYDEIYPSPDPNFYISGRRNEAHTLLMGLVDVREEPVIPFKYTGVKINAVDSLIVGCTAGMGANSEDDIYDYKGKKLGSYHKHVEIATKNYLVHRIFHPEEYLLIVNLKNKEERKEFAEEVRVHSDHELLMMNEGHWFTYDVVSHKKKPFETKHKK